MIQLLKEWKSQKWGFHCPLCKPEGQTWRTLVRSVTCQLKRTLRHQWTEPLWWRGGNESSVRGAQPPHSSPESLCTTLLLLVSQSLSGSGDCSINKFCIFIVILLSRKVLWRPSEFCFSPCDVVKCVSFLPSPLFHSACWWELELMGHLGFWPRLLGLGRSHFL